MTRDEAVAQIQEGLGFTSEHSDRIIRRLVQAQNELETGKTLPRFLLEEDFPIELVEGTRETAYPDGFLRESDEGYMYASDLEHLVRVPDMNTGLSLLFEVIDSETINTVQRPRFYMMRSQSIWFFTPADQTYTLSWTFYKAGDSLLTSQTNVWLDDEAGARWLMGEAGYWMARTLRDAEAVALFDDMRKQARAAVLSEILAEEDFPLTLGSAH